MKGKLTLQQRLILPIILLGLVTLLSNILAVFSINNVNGSARRIVEEYMVSETRLEEIRRSIMEIHRLALSHIVAADHASMIKLVQDIKTEEAALDEMLAEYESFVSEQDMGTYQTLTEEYEALKHALVGLVCASADSKTQEAYAMANGEVEEKGGGAKAQIDILSASVSAQAEKAKNRLSVVYMTSLVISAVTLAAGVLLVLAAFRIIRKYVIAPIKDAMGMLQDSSRRISGVVSEVRERTRTSSASVQALSALSGQLSAAVEEVAGNAAAITSSASGTQNDANEMAEECAEITGYSVKMRERAEEMGFGRVVRTTPARHDQMIAFTSQLPHALACAYVMSPRCPEHQGFSAGSYRDVSRVANINDALWSRLFLDNQKALTQELDQLIANLSRLRDAVDRRDQEELRSLLRTAAQIKRQVG